MLGEWRVGGGLGEKKEERTAFVVLSSWLIWVLYESDLQVELKKCSPIFLVQRCIFVSTC